MPERYRRRFWEIIGGLALISIGVSTLLSADAPFIPVLIGLGGFYLLAKQFDKHQNSAAATPGQRDRQQNDRPARTASSAEGVRSHALLAVRRAGREPDETQVLPVDIGLIAYQAGQDPFVCSTQAIPDDVDYIQPYVNLRVPRRASGAIRFDIVDSGGQHVFYREDERQLDRGRNLITPAARLPVHDELAFDGDWELHVSADGLLLATHRFGWQASETVAAPRPRLVDDDGELSAELRAAMLDGEPGPMSLDDLLGSMDQQQAARR